MRRSREGIRRLCGRAQGGRAWESRERVEQGGSGHNGEQHVRRRAQGRTARKAQGLQFPRKVLLRVVCVMRALSA